MSEVQGEMLADGCMCLRLEVSAMHRGLARMVHSSAVLVSSGPEQQSSSRPKEVVGPDTHDETVLRVKEADLIVAVARTPPGDLTPRTGGECVVVCCEPSVCAASLVWSSSCWQRQAAHWQLVRQLHGGCVAVATAASTGVVKNPGKEKTPQA
jgi:hypothetical protein